MTIKMLFEIRKAYFLITIKGKQICYWDKEEGPIWGGALQYLPPDPNALIKIRNSRNKIPAIFIDLLKISAEELKEFDDAEGETELKEIVIRDVKKHGGKLIDIKIE